MAGCIPDGYQRLNDILLVRLPSEAIDQGPLIGRLYREELKVASVLAIERVGKGALRQPVTHLLSGEETETTVRDGPISYTLDTARLLYSAGNMEERHRVAGLVRPGERVADLFAGIGYFAIPAAKLGCASIVYAVEKNPCSFAYLKRNIEANGVGGIVVPILGDNRCVDIPTHYFNRVFLGYLPSSLPYVAKASELLSPPGGWLHLHTVSSSHPGSTLMRAVREALARNGVSIVDLAAFKVKSYGPYRDHVVLDILVSRSAG